MAMKSAKPDFQTVKHYTPHFISSKKKKILYIKLKGKLQTNKKLFETNIAMGKNKNP